jgi:hypothetical protein
VDESSNIQSIQREHQKEENQTEGLKEKKYSILCIFTHKKTNQSFCIIIMILIIMIIIIIIISWD